MLLGLRRETREGGGSNGTLGRPQKEACCCRTQPHVTNSTALKRCPPTAFGRQRGGDGDDTLAGGNNKKVKDRMMSRRVERQTEGQRQRQGPG